MSRFLSRTELCEFLGVSKDTLKEMERTEGALPPAIIVGKSRKYDRDAIEKHFRPQAEQVKQ
jgi:predicted site-specific integrase-resolvase